MREMAFELNLRTRMDAVEVHERRRYAGLMSRETTAVVEDGTTAGVAAEKAKVPAKHGSDAAAWLTDSRSLVTETITNMDLPRISFLHKEITKTAIGFDRIQFITTMAT